MKSAVMPVCFGLVLLSACGGSEPETSAQAPDAADVSAVSANNAHVEPENMPSGSALFAAHCESCHAAGDGHPGTMRLKARLSAEQAVLTEREDLTAAYVAGVIRNGLMMMPPFRPSELSATEVQAIAAYLSRTKPGAGQ